MIFLEDYVKEGGKIFISPIHDNHLRLTTRSFGKRHTVDSQKGIEYLLRHIEQKLAQNEELLTVVEEKFPYTLSWNKMTTLDHLLNKSTVHIYGNKTHIFADLYQIHISERLGFPGIQVCQLKSDRKTVLELLRQEPKSFETTPFPKDVEGFVIPY